MDESTQVFAASELRNRFDLNLSFENLLSGDITRLAEILMFECALHNVSQEPGVKFWVPSLKGDCIEMSLKDSPDYRCKHIECACIYVDGMYFERRPAIEFCMDGSIRLATWCDKKNCQPIYRAFDKWMTELIAARESARLSEVA